jgi:hypothetical protein
MPKKIGEKPLTKAEVMARYRAKKKAAGFKEKFRWVNTQEEERRAKEKELEATERLRREACAERARKKENEMEIDKKIEETVKKRGADTIIFLLRVMEIEAKNRPALSEAVEFVSSEFIPKYYPDLIGRK